MRPGANPGLFAAWLLGLEANEDPTGLIGLGQAIVRVFLYVACMLDGDRADFPQKNPLTMIFTNAILVKISFSFPIPFSLWPNISTMSVARLLRFQTRCQS
ncbi:MAG: hypothetical protein KDE45_24250 [Caldilineaceae bacterium]|nr:hypothetical protein [Caldilineaceae bacterium]